MKRLRRTLAQAWLCSLLLPMGVHATPGVITITFVCPKPAGSDFQSLVRQGNRIMGYGTEMIDSQATVNHPFFTTVIPAGAIIPLQLSMGAYTNAGASYDDNTETIACSYSSSLAFNPFTVSYAAVLNAPIGVISQTANTLVLYQYLGAKG